MKAWTIQSKTAWDMLQKNGHLSGEKSLIMEPTWFSAYNWMLNQMELRVGVFNPNLFPIWVWTNRRPDLREERFCYPNNETFFLIELNLDPKKVLISDFQAWHYVLNRWYLCKDERDDQNWEQKMLNRFGSSCPEIDKLPKPYQQLIEKSWERIFDLELMQRDQKNPYHQGVIQQITLDNIISYKKFLGCSKN